VSGAGPFARCPPIDVYLYILRRNLVLRERVLLQVAGDVSAPEERERLTTRLPGGFMLLAGRVDPQAIAGHALEETGADGIGCVFVDGEED
jgi:hypothetical protein